MSDDTPTMNPATRNPATRNPATRDPATRDPAMLDPGLLDGAAPFGDELDGGHRAPLGHHALEDALDQLATIDPVSHRNVVTTVVTNVVTTSTPVATTSTPVTHTDDGDDHDDGDVTGRLIRPYAITGGRTGADGPEIHLESQIQASADAASHASSYRWEAAKVIELVREPMALVEIAARLEVPVGVARVLVADLLQDGSVILHVPARSQSFTSLLEKVLDGVRNL